MKKKCFLEVNAFREKHHVGGIKFHEHKSVVVFFFPFLMVLVLTILLR